MLHTDGHDVAWSLCLRNVVGPSSVPTLPRCNRMQCRAASSEQRARVLLYRKIQENIARKIQRKIQENIGKYENIGKQDEPSNISTSLFVRSLFIIISHRTYVYILFNICTIDHFCDFFKSYGQNLNSYMCCYRNSYIVPIFSYIHHRIGTIQELNFPPCNKQSSDDDDIIN